MAAVKKVLDDNKSLLATAAIFETGRIANNKLAQLVGGQLPQPAGMLAQTPIGQLVLANVVKLAGEQFRPGDETIARLTNGMVVAAYTQLIQQFDIESILDELMGDRGIKAALKKQADAEE